MMDRALEHRLADFEAVVVQRDADLAETVLHRDFELVLVIPAAVRMPRHRWLEVLPDYMVERWDVEERYLDVCGDTATLLQRVDMTATVLDQDRSGTFVMSDVWVQGEDGWKVWRRHSTPLQAGVMPGVR